MVPQHIAPVEDRAVEEDARHPCSQIGLGEHLHTDRPAHRPSAEGDGPGAPAHGIPDGVVNVPPLGETERVSAVEAAGRVGVVAVCGDQDGQTRFVERTDSPDAFQSQSAPAMHENGPPVTAARCGHEPGREVTDLGLDRHRSSGEAERLLR
ncbi:MAG: hypothetical protein LC679_15240 [Intrasporangiaceae bacterium]|nr:hypothetical protein [Intrasporangiaceae bacterium]